LEVPVPPRARRSAFIDLSFVEQDVFALLVLESLGGVLVFDQAQARRHLLVADPLAGRLGQLDDCSVLVAG